MINPYQTEPSIVMDKYTFQIELGALNQHFGDHLTYTAIPTIGLAYGLADKIELQFSMQSDNYKSELFGEEGKYQHWSDLSFGPKIQLLNREDVNMQIAFWSQAVFPTSEPSKGSPLGVSNKLSISHSFSQKIAVVYNLGYDYMDDTNVFTYALALGYEFSEKLGIYAEPYGFYDDTEVFESNIDFGISYLTGNIGFDLTLGFGINNTHQLIAGRFTWDFPFAFRSKK